MNTNALKKFAQDTRKKLLQQVNARLELVLTTDSAALREKATALKKLQEAINATSKEQVVDKVAYTWFNRLMALRFMDANDYQPIGVSVVTPWIYHTKPCQPYQPKGASRITLNRASHINQTVPV